MSVVNIDCNSAGLSVFIAGEATASVAPARAAAADIFTTRNFGDRHALATVSSILLKDVRHRCG
jgi:hypothetical protein